jgi:hypothetical protein
MKAVGARVALWRGGKGRSHLLGASIVAGMWLGAACGGAEGVNVPPVPNCTPRLCTAPDVPPGPPGGAELCPTGVCNYQTQQGCPSNQTCAVSIDQEAGQAVPKCVGFGLRKAGEPCDTRTIDPTRPADPNLICGRGLQCIGEPSKGQICRKLCCGGAPYGDWRACDPGESCIRQIKPRIERPPGSGTFVDLDAHVSFCVPVNTCDVLDPESCKGDGGDPARPVCRIVDPLGRTACRPKHEENSMIGTPCMSEEQCGPVQHCVQRTDPAGIPQEETPTCRRLCRLSDMCGPDGCQGQGICVHFKRDPEGVGECTPNFDGTCTDRRSRVAYCR